MEKSNSPSCIYCTHAIHDLKHMLWECKSLNDIWKLIQGIINVTIYWKTVPLGINNEPNMNSIISLICYIIYKKYLSDRDCDPNNIIPINRFIYNELGYRLNVYHNVCDVQCVTLLQNAMLAFQE